MDLRQVLTELEESLSHYWSHPYTDQAEVLAELREALAVDDEQRLEATATTLKNKLDYYWALPNTGQAELLAKLNAVLTVTA